jgi:transposase
VGACAAAQRPLHALIERRALVAERLHGDDNTVPILAKNRRSPAGCGSMSAMSGRSPSRDCTREHPNRHLASYAGILQPDAFDG